jgi:hypothetical protein
MSKSTLFGIVNKFQLSWSKIQNTTNPSLLKSMFIVSSTNLLMVMIFWYVTSCSQLGNSLYIWFSMNLLLQQILLSRSWSLRQTDLKCRKWWKFFKCCVVCPTCEEILMAPIYLFLNFISHTSKSTTIISLGLFHGCPSCGGLQQDIHKHLHWFVEECEWFTSFKKVWIISTSSIPCIVWSK